MTQFSNQPLGSGNQGGGDTTTILPQSNRPAPGSSGGPGNPGPATNNTRLVIIALVLAVVAVILMNLYVELVKAQTIESDITVYRFKASYNVGEDFREQMVEPVKLPERYADSFRSFLDERQMRTRIGEVFTRPTRQNEFLTAGVFESFGGEGLDRETDVGKRTKAIRVNPRTLPNIAPGMYIDIEAPFNVSGYGLRVVPVMERVKVMSVGRRTIIDQRNDTGRASSGFTTVDIELDPEDATLMAAIQLIAAGDFEIHIRNPADRATPKIPEGTLNPAVLEFLRRPNSVIRPE